VRRPDGKTATASFLAHRVEFFGSQRKVVRQETRPVSPIPQGGKLIIEEKTTA
jgi:hypothetical protein